MRFIATLSLCLFSLINAAQAKQHHHHRGGHGMPWCGLFMRHNYGGPDPGPAFNLARRWASWGARSSAQLGAIVVWPHHVGKIVGQQNGQWLVLSGNDGGRVRIRPRSLAGVIAIRTI